MPKQAFFLVDPATMDAIQRYMQTHPAPHVQTDPIIRALQNCPLREIEFRNELPTDDEHKPDEPSRGGNGHNRIKAH